MMEEVNIDETIIECIENIIIKGVPIQVHTQDPYNEFGFLSAIKLINDCKISSQSQAWYQGFAIQTVLKTRKPDLLTKVSDDLVCAVNKAMSGSYEHLQQYHALAQEVIDSTRSEWIQEEAKKQKATKIILQDQEVYLPSFEETEIISEYTRINAENFCSGEGSNFEKYMLLGKKLDELVEKDIRELTEPGDEKKLIRRAADARGAYSFLLLIELLEQEHFDSKRADLITRIEWWRTKEEYEGGEYFLRQQIKDNPQLGKTLDDEHNWLMLSANNELLRRGININNTVMYVKGAGITCPINTKIH